MIKLVTRTLWQWSIGRFVKIIPPEGITVDAVHFYNGTTENALIGVHKADGNAIISEIPNILLQSSNNLTVYAMMTDATGETTVECTTFGVLKRPRPDNYVYSETEIKSWYNLVSRIDELEKASEESYEQIKNAVDEYLLNYTEQIEKNKQEIEVLHRDKLSSEHLGEYIEDALYIAKETGMFDGKDGMHGEPGVTPHIGDNGNWFIGTMDTGVSAEGEAGGYYIPDVTQIAADKLQISFTPSDTGMHSIPTITVNLPRNDPGQNTLSWNDLTDKPFYSDLSEIPLIENVAGSWKSGERPGVFFDTPINITAGKTYKTVVVSNIKGADATETHEVTADYNGEIRIPIQEYELYIFNDGASINGYNFAGSIDISVYEIGGSVKTLDPMFLPEEHINSLIDSKLGVIENGAY